MIADRLRRLRTMLGEALALPHDDRSAFVARATDDDAALRDELTQLLAIAEQEDPMLEPPATTPATAPQLHAGDRLGAWQLDRRIGQGGMGEVWLAARADGAFDQRVAIKVPRAARLGPGAIARFERERALLAELEDPGVARLVDGGWTATGLPWLAMEYVEGEAIDQHARARQLDARARVRLLLAACRVLAAAHRRRIVHRDLKPGNVLVRPDGHVVLVDFGIAAALDRSNAATVEHLATPRYGAPEQLGGAAATTAADVYSLATLGRELIGDPDEDLAAVFEAATRTDPEARTPSIDLFAAELQRWLDHRPVEARRPPASHLLRLWWRRAPGTAATVLSLAALAVGLCVVATVLWRAERAERERASVANEQKDRRLAQVRALVRELVFGVHDRIAALPGAVPARAFLVERAERHLEALAADGAEDAGVAQELVEVHLRLADVRGARTYGHLGDLEGAMRSARAAVATASLWHARQPSAGHWPLLLARGHRLAGDLSRAQGHAADARASYAAARSALAEATTAEARTERARIDAAIRLQLARLDVDEGRLEAALLELRSVQAHYDELADDGPHAGDSARNAALALAEQGYVLSQLDREAEAGAALDVAMQRFAALCTASPDDAQLTRDRIEVEVELALTLAESAAGEAAARFERALAAARALVARDPDNLLSERTVHRALLRGARLALRQRDAGRSASRYREIEPLLRTAMQRSGDDRMVRTDLAEALIGRAEADRRSGATDDVAAAFEEGAALLDADRALAARDHHAGNLLTMAWIGLGNLALAGGELATARDRFERSRGPAAAWAEAHAALAWPLQHLALIEHGLGSASEALAADDALPLAERVAHLRSAHDAYTRGLEVATRLAAAGRLRGADKAMPKFFELDAQRVQAAIRQRTERQR